MSKFKFSAAAALVAAGVITPLVLQHRTASDLRRDLSAQATELTGLRAENSRLSKLASRASSAGSLTPEQLAELTALRTEAGKLRGESDELKALRLEVAQLRKRPAAPTGATAPEVPGPDEIASAKAVIFDSASAVDAKLSALRVLRTADARADDIVKQMVQIYYATEDANARADIFRQLNGVKTPELKRPLLEAVSDASQPARMREEAAETLSAYLPDPDVKEWLDHLAANDPESDVREQAGKSLEEFARRERK